jgi:hypothetical protein
MATSSLQRRHLLAGKFLGMALLMILCACRQRGKADVAATRLIPVLAGAIAHKKTTAGGGKLSANDNMRSSSAAMKRGDSDSERRSERRSRRGRKQRRVEGRRSGRMPKYVEGGSKRSRREKMQKCVGGKRRRRLAEGSRQLHWLFAKFLGDCGLPLQRL